MLQIKKILIIDNTMRSGFDLDIVDEDDKIILDQSNSMSNDDLVNLMTNIDTTVFDGNLLIELFSQDFNLTFDHFGSKYFGNNFDLFIMNISKKKIV